VSHSPVTGSCLKGGGDFGAFIFSTARVTVICHERIECHARRTIKAATRIAQDTDTAITINGEFASRDFDVAGVKVRACAAIPSGGNCGGCGGDISIFFCDSAGTVDRSDVEGGVNRADIFPSGGGVGGDRGFGGGGEAGSAGGGANSAIV